MSTQSINAEPRIDPLGDASGSRHECRSYYMGLRAGWVSAGGEIDLATAPELELVVRRAERRALLMVLDLRGVTFMDSTGVHLLVDANRRAARHGRRLVTIVNSGSQVQRLMELTCLHRVLEIIDSPAPAPPRARHPKPLTT